MGKHQPALHDYTVTKERCKFCKNEVSVTGDFVCTLCSTKVVLASGSKITVNGTLEVAGEVDAGAGGIVYTGQTAGYHARLYVETNAFIIVNGTMKVSGYIIDVDPVDGEAPAEIAEADANLSTVTVNSGGSIYQPFTLRDFKGGSRTAAIKFGMSSYGYSPFYQFMFMNILPETRINYGGHSYSYANIYCEGFNAAIAPLIGYSAESQASLIQLTTSESYAITDYDLETEIMSIDLYGGAKTKQFKVELDTPLGHQSASSQEFVFPISWMYDITLNDGSYEMREGNKFKLLPGAKLTVSSDATLDVEQLSIYDDTFVDTFDVNPYPTIYPESSSLAGQKISGAEMIVNGAVVADSIGGKVVTTVDGASVSISKATKIITYEASLYDSMSIKRRTTVVCSLKLYYGTEVVGYTESGTTYSSVSTPGKTWIPDREITMPTPITMDVPSDYIVKTNEALSFDENGAFAGYYSYDSSIDGPATIKVFPDALITFTLNNNQVFLPTGATSNLDCYSAIVLPN